ncbi:MAG: hypothetical protein C0603_11890 [Denitrovibrio sp.]|nr:MAG: hypothetical protein C0603_11890 [Denitrovibrio sp.]
MKEDIISEVRIFYVEDEPAIREGFVRFLRRRTDNLFVFTNGKEALDAFEEYKPDLIITDIRMPVMDGLEMSDKIKKLNPTVPIIVTTGHNDEELFLKSINIGIDKYIKKPIDFAYLIDVIKKITASIIHEKQMEKQNDFLREVLDLNPNFVITTNGVKCTYLNESFKEFLGVSNVSDYIERYVNINSVLVQKEEMFYTGKSVRDWILETQREQIKNRMVVLQPLLSNEETTCLMNIKAVPEKDEWLLSFADVTMLEKEKQLYRMLSQQDPLTKINNRKKFFDEVEKELERVVRYGQDVSLLIMDIDFFKEVNDRYGHLAGDKVLIELTEIVSNNIRKSDVFARYGGEEFVLMMPGTDLEGAHEKADHIRKIIAEHKFSNCGQVTCSFGVASYKTGDTVDSFVQKADIALYYSKESGRNKVSIFEEGSIQCSG